MKTFIVFVRGREIGDRENGKRQFVRGGVVAWRVDSTAKQIQSEGWGTGWGKGMERVGGKRMERSGKGEMREKQENG